MRRYLSALMLGAFLIAPVAIKADDHHDHRYYDRDRRDYHEWNDGEARAYRHWLEAEQHRRYHDWSKASRREQRDYWKWRHDHGDWR